MSKHNLLKIKLFYAGAKQIVHTRVGGRSRRVVIVLLSYTYSYFVIEKICIYSNPNYIHIRNYNKLRGGIIVVATVIRETHTIFCDLLCDHKQINLCEIYICKFGKKITLS